MDLDRALVEDTGDAADDDLWLADDRRGMIR
jgi:hypothetical protein